MRSPLLDERPVDVVGGAHQLSMSRKLHVVKEHQRRRVVRRTTDEKVWWPYHAALTASTLRAIEGDERLLTWFVHSKFGLLSLMTVVGLGLTLVRCVEDELLFRALVFAFGLRAGLPVLGVGAFSMLASAAKAGFFLPFQTFHALLSVALAATACVLHAVGRDSRKNIAFVFGFAASAGPLSQGALLEVTWHVVDFACRWRHAEPRSGGVGFDCLQPCCDRLVACVVRQASSTVEPTS